MTERLYFPSFLSYFNVVEMCLAFYTFSDTTLVKALAPVLLNRYLVFCFLSSLPQLTGRDSHKHADRFKDVRLPQDKI